jgi:hypothetical protein
VSHSVVLTTSSCPSIYYPSQLDGQNKWGPVRGDLLNLIYVNIDGSEYPVPYVHALFTSANIFTTEVSTDV